MRTRPAPEKLGSSGAGWTIDLVAIPPGRVRLPDLDQRPADRPSVLVEHPAADDDPLPERLALVLARQVGVRGVERVLAEDRPGESDGPPPEASRAVAPARASGWSDTPDSRSGRRRRRTDRPAGRSRSRGEPPLRARGARRAPRRSAEPSLARPARRRGSQPVAARTSSTSTPGWTATSVSSPSRGSSTPRSVTTTRTRSPRLVLKSRRGTKVRGEWWSITKTSPTYVAISGAPPAPGRRTRGRS